MSLLEMLPEVRQLTRSDKLRLLQVIAADLIENDPLDLLRPGESYPIVSPHRAYEAAQALMTLLNEEREKS